MFLPYVYQGTLTPWGWSRHKFTAIVTLITIAAPSRWMRVTQGFGHPKKSRSVTILGTINLHCLELTEHRT